MKKKLLFIPIALMLVFSTVACTSKTTVTEKVKSEEVKVKDEAVKVENKVDKNLINYKDIKITPMKAYDLFKEKYPDMLVKRMELDRKGEVGSFLYRVEGFNKTSNGVTSKEVNIEPVTGDVSDTDTKLDIHLNNQTEITTANVEKIQAFIDKSLLDAGTGSTVKQWKLRWDDKVLKFELSVDLPGFGDVDYIYNLETGDLIDRD